MEFAELESLKMVLLWDCVTYGYTSARYRACCCDSIECNVLLTTALHYCRPQLIALQSFLAAAINTALPCLQPI